MSDALCPALAGARAAARALRLAPVVLASVALLAACGGNGAAPQQTVTVTAPAGSASTNPTTAPSGGQPGSGEPGIVAVSSAGALEVLNPANGSITQTLVPG